MVGAASAFELEGYVGFVDVVVCLAVVLGLDGPDCGVGCYGVLGEVHFECFF